MVLQGFSFLWLWGKKKKPFVIFRTLFSSFYFSSFFACFHVFSTKAIFRIDGVCLEPKLAVFSRFRLFWDPKLAVS